MSFSNNGLPNLPPPPGGFGALPPPPGASGLPPPPLSNSFASQGLGGSRPTLSTGLPPPPGSGLQNKYASGSGFMASPAPLGSGLPPPPGPPPATGSSFNSNPLGLSTRLPGQPSIGSSQVSSPAGNSFSPTPPGLTTGLPPPPGSSRGASLVLPPPPGGSSDLPPPPGGSYSSSPLGLATGLPPPPGTTRNSYGLPPPVKQTTQDDLPPPPPMSTGLPPPPASGSLPPPPMSTGLPPPPMSGGLPPPPASGGLPPPPISGGLPPPSYSSKPPLAGGFDSGGLPPPPGSSQFNSRGGFAPPLSTGLPPPPRMDGSTSRPGFSSIPGGGLTSGSDSTPEMSLLKTCKACNTPCKETFIFAVSNYYHPDCLKCAKCDSIIKPPSCVFLRDQLVCSNCATKTGSIVECDACHQLIEDMSDLVEINEISKSVHKNCHRCYECSCLLDRSYEIIDNQTLCTQCKEIAVSRSCSRCSQPIIGRYTFDRGRYFHVRCFTCKSCDRILNGKNFVIHHNEYYCPEHGIIYLKTCSYCKGDIIASDQTRIRWMNKYYHQRCFCCRICGTQIDPPSKAKQCHGRPHCNLCFRLRVDDGEIDENGNVIDNNHAHDPILSHNRRKKFQEMYPEIKVFFPRYRSEIEKASLKSKRSKRKSKRY